VLNGVLWRGARNAAAELGHMIVMIDGPLCGCGRRGCIEALASRTAIERDIWGEIRGGRHSIIEADTVHGGDITSGTIEHALEERDPVVTDVMERASYHLGIFTASVVNAIDPACVVYGGGLIEACGGFMLPVIRDATYRHLIRPVDPQKLPIVAAALGDNATVIGGAMLAQAALAEREEG
jgi:glucokinase